MWNEPPGLPPQGRQKMNYACEACRAAKTKCQSGLQPGICKRCSEFKRECIFRSGPRTRRPKAPRLDAESAALPPPPGPSKTFSIDFDMPVAEEPSDDFEILRQQHERILHEIDLSDGDEEGGQPLFEEGAANFGTDLSARKEFSFNDMASSPSVCGTSSSWAESGTGSATSSAARKSRPMMNLGIKPQFNLDSASRLLASFRGMLPHLPCLVLPEDLEVRTLARNRPFVLLAILAVTSCSNSLQGHSLYDEEFRKVLGLKFVAGGERSLELLQGMLIYCAWYPFHLRPKNRQSLQYIRMGVDIVHDLELDQESDLNLAAMAPDQRARRLDDLRALLSCFYSMSALASTWGKMSTLRYTPQIARCAEALEQNSELEQDQNLVWMVRFQYIFEELVEAQRNFRRGFRDYQSEMQRDLIRVGLETQLRDYKEKMPAQRASMTSILLLLVIIDVYVLAPDLFRFRRRPGKDPSEPASPDHLLLAAHKVRAFLDHVTSLTSRQLGRLSGPDCGRLIVGVILAYRLSFPLLGVCSEYDVAQGRRILDFGAFLRQLTTASAEEEEEEGEEEKKKKKGKEQQPKGAKSASGGCEVVDPARKRKRKTDAASALKVVLGSVRNKYEEKSAALEAISAAAAATSEWAGKDGRSICPMLNGSLDQYLPLWAGQQGYPTAASSYATSQTSTSGVMTDVLSAAGTDPMSALAAPIDQTGMGMGMGMGAVPFEDKPLMYHDLWTAMTMDWGGDMGEVNMEDISNPGYNVFDLC
ncbi:hypothetical protein F5Y19DRAFT_468738 [Xylariaceae sp. FL1651]|nr:hypothetical protein F5Y19DRAFT_468738 [Xylariaceae sp. FL1651]